MQRLDDGTRAQDEATMIPECRAETRLRDGCVKSNPYANECCVVATRDGQTMGHNYFSFGSKALYNLCVSPDVLTSGFIPTASPSPALLGG